MPFSQRWREGHAGWKMSVCHVLWRGPQGLTYSKRHTHILHYQKIIFEPRELGQVGELRWFSFEKVSNSLILGLDRRYAE